MACEYCNGTKVLEPENWEGALWELVSDSFHEIRINTKDGPMVLVDKEGRWAIFECNFCPMCGAEIGDAS